MAKKSTPSSIDRLDPQIRDLIGTLRRGGRTIDEILAKLRELDVDVSRSALGRHVKGLAEIAEQMAHSRVMAESLVAKFGDQPDNKLARLNLELMHGMVFRLASATRPDEDGVIKPVTFDPEETMFLSRALGSLVSAEKTNTDRILKARAEAAKEAANVVDAVAKDRPAGLTKDTVDEIKRRIMGIAS